MALWDRRRVDPPLKRLLDQGGTAKLTPEEMGISDTLGWTDPFLITNRDALHRLGIATHVAYERNRAVITLIASDQLGAVPLQSHVTRKVAAGLLVTPRFGWSSVGRVLGEVGFRVEPAIGGFALVPGSAREVPPWVLAGPVVTRLAALIDRLSRTFVPVMEERQSPRGTVDWASYATRALPTGRWTSFACRYSDLGDDPDLLAALRWTLHRVGQDLEDASDSLVARLLLDRVTQLLARLGPGRVERPRPGELTPALASDWLRLALEAVAWIRDERGLGGARSLDGLPWSLPVDLLWEAWVEAFLSALSSKLGGRLRTARQGSTSRPLVWQSAARSLGHLAPDFILELPDRTICVDAKYKDHYLRLHQQHWTSLDEQIHESHRADLHQALAYALLADKPLVDTFLVYPRFAADPDASFATARLTAGERNVRLLLAAIPFGFEGPAQRNAVLAAWERAIRSVPA